MSLLVNCQSCEIQIYPSQGYDICEETGNIKCPSCHEESAFAPHELLRIGATLHDHTRKFSGTFSQFLVHSRDPDDFPGRFTHEGFISRYRQENISLLVSGAYLTFLIRQLPRRYQFAHYFWTWMWVLSIPGFITVAVFVQLWVGLLLLAFGTPLIASSVKKSARTFVLDYATEDQDFFRYLDSSGLIVAKRPVE